MYEHILVPIAFADGHEGVKAINVARHLADENTRITLLHVMEEVPGFAISYMPEGYQDELLKAVQSELEAKTADLPNATAKVVHGHAGRTIVDIVDEIGADCIVISSHKPGMADLLIGSTAARVVRHAPCSVHVIR